MPGVISQKVSSHKLKPPCVTPEQVQRQALCERVCGAGMASVALLRAPAGFGKTALMVQAQARLERGSVATAWLTLDRQDNEPLRLLASLAAATSHFRPDELAATGPLATVELLASHPSPFVLFLDEFEAIEEADALELLREVIARLPRHGRIVIGTRGHPNVGLGKLRARGQLVEIDAEQMRFSLEETKALLKLRGIEVLQAGDVVRLHAKTEGWVTALWLACITLSQGVKGADFIEQFSGSERAVADYLTEEVLSRQNGRTREFLLKTSILRLLDPSICGALNPRENASDVLERLADANLFLTPVTGEPNTWRYDRLFADYLRTQLEREQPAEYARLHLAASSWYASQGNHVPAIDHAMEGGDYPYALQLLSGHALDFLNQGRIGLLARWFSIIPSHLLAAQPLMQVISAWAICFTRGPFEAMEALRRSGCAQCADEAVLANVNALKTLLLISTDRHDEAYASGLESLRALPSPFPFADALLITNMSHLTATLGDKEEARRMIARARRTHPDSAFNQMCADASEGILDLQQGKLRHATARFRIAAGASATASNPVLPARGNAWAGVLLADVMYEAHQLDTCEYLLNVYLPLARGLGLPERMISCGLMLARIAFQRGDIDRAFDELIKLEYYGQSRQLPRLVASARLERSRLLLQQGNRIGSRVELERAADSAVWTWVRRHRQVVHDLDYFELAQLRWELTFGDAAAAIAQLRAEFEDAMSRGLERRALKIELLRALALERTGATADATKLMKTVLVLACQEGFVRLVLDEGQAAVRLIHRVHAGTTSSHSVFRDPIYIDYLQRLIEFAGPVAADSSPQAGKLIEPLTRKEVRVLKLLAEGYSNNAMAEKLFVSESTVRTHLRNINMKLSSASRTQAVAIARQLDLLR